MALLARSAAMPTAAEIREFVLESLSARSTNADPQSIIAVDVPAYRVPIEHAAQCLTDSCTFLWQAPSGEQTCGAGTAVELPVRGDDRFKAARIRGKQLFERVVSIHYPGPRAPDVRLFGGFSFATGSSNHAPWRDFGDGHFTLPRLSYHTQDQQAWLRMYATNWDSPAATRMYASHIAATYQRLSDSTTWAKLQSAAPRVSSVDEPAIDEWTRHIDEIKQLIADDRCQKIVASRSSVLTLSEQANPLAILANLSQRYDDCFRFLYQRGNATFVGATPERLIRLRGDAVATEALAGSISSDVAGAADTLLRSAKDRREHGLVVDELHTALRDVCRELMVPPVPAVRRLRHVLHLETRITGRLASPRHVLELVKRLHPTPAVGGVPTQFAMQWIRDRERHSRGWYAAPIGWFDAEGNGEFAVAIRSGLLAGTATHLFAGAGIVSDSNAESELAETRIKLKPLLSALALTTNVP